MSFLKLKTSICKLDADHRLYNLSIPIIGLTGGIATGKSTVSKLLEEKGVPLIDADALVKDVYRLEATKRLAQRLVPQSLKENGEIDFKTLRKAFFEDAAVKEKLEKRVYACLGEAFQRRLKLLQNPSFVIYDVPLLFEKELQSKFDATVLVYADRATQLSRLVARDAIDEELANTILNHQKPIDEKRHLSQFIINNTSDINSLERETQKVLDQLLQTRV